MHAPKNALLVEPEFPVLAWIERNVPLIGETMSRQHKSHIRKIYTNEH